ncbi:hypothetical protein GCM10023323_22080 [Streptomyces thinghirensis]|uniref:ATP-binding protein n=1 Tax=Streptomyces thinghirensis TaxID=551547 RepID=A0ABP9T009_9ACTN
MADTVGGMILVGINDKAEPGVERAVGADAQGTIDEIASACSKKLDPALGAGPPYRPVPRCLRAERGGHPGRPQRCPPTSAD